MNILIRKVLIADSSSPYNGFLKDILIVNGVIQSIEDAISTNADIIIDEEHLVISQGWVDVFAHFNDPGYEFKETLQSGARAAAAGGFTHVFVVPNTNPAIQSKTQIEYIVQASKPLQVQIHPIGAVTKNIEGKELAEMYDMKASGAVAFSDGLHAIQTPGLLLKAFQYVKAFNGTIIQLPIDKSIGGTGLMNEGIVSTQLGLPGIPAIAEELMIKRDIDLLRYTQSKLHITGISTSASIELIQQARKDGLAITCSVSPHHLFFCDEDLVQYDTNLKTNPPLRSRADMLALRKAVADETIDSIASHHLPQDWDNKTCEFEYAANGMISLQTVFAVLNTVLPELDHSQIAHLLSLHAREAFGLPLSTIDIGKAADCTLFTKNGSTTLAKTNNHSKSSNSPFFDKTLQGKVIGTITKGNYYSTQKTN